MPIYEYRCNDCGCVSEVLVQGFSPSDNPRCSRCGSENTRRLISRVNYHSSHSDRLAAYDPETSQSESFCRDTRNIGLHAEKMLQKSGVEPTDEFKAKLDRLRTDPSKIMKDDN